ncbi:MAG: prepilin-type N-terminal cleavage/methylation domain-containing protein, partial [Deltaproteobacteria bacterium]|nr:prepilin-type N-terminal cleavage/methylation domain-containing protein [Deltaproteobacteria bacterium]
LPQETLLEGGSTTDPIILGEMPTAWDPDLAAHWMEDVTKKEKVLKGAFQKVREALVSKKREIIIQAVRAFNTQYADFRNYITGKQRLLSLEITEARNFNDRLDAKLKAVKKLKEAIDNVLTGRGKKPGLRPKDGHRRGAALTLVLPGIILAGVASSGVVLDSKAITFIIAFFAFFGLLAVVGYGMNKQEKAAQTTVENEPEQVRKSAVPPVGNPGIGLAFVALVFGGIVLALSGSGKLPSESYINIGERTSSLDPAAIKWPHRMAVPGSERHLYSGIDHDKASGLSADDLGRLKRVDPELARIMKIAASKINNPERKGETRAIKKVWSLRILEPEGKLEKMGLAVRFGLYDKHGRLLDSAIGGPNGVDYVKASEMIWNIGYFGFGEDLIPGGKHDLGFVRKESDNPQLEVEIMRKHGKSPGFSRISSMPRQLFDKAPIIIFGFILFSLMGATSQIASAADLAGNQATGVNLAGGVEQGFQGWPAAIFIIGTIVFLIFAGVAASRKENLEKQQAGKKLPDTRGLPRARKAQSVDNKVQRVAVKPVAANKEGQSAVAFFWTMLIIIGLIVVVSHYYGGVSEEVTAFVKDYKYKEFMSEKDVFSRIFIKIFAPLFGFKKPDFQGFNQLKNALIITMFIVAAGLMGYAGIYSDKNRGKQPWKSQSVKTKAGKSQQDRPKKKRTKAYWETHWTIFIAAFLSLAFYKLTGNPSPGIALAVALPSRPEDMSENEYKKFMNLIDAMVRKQEARVKALYYDCKYLEAAKAAEVIAHLERYDDDFDMLLFFGQVFSRAAESWSSQASKGAAKTLDRLRDIKLSVKCLEQACELINDCHSGWYEVNFELGAVYSAWAALMRDTDVEIVKRKIVLLKGAVSALDEAAMVAKHQGRLEDSAIARSLLEDAELKLDIAIINRNYLRGRMFKQSGNYSDALELLEEAFDEVRKSVELRPSKEVADLLATIYEELDELYQRCLLLGAGCRLKGENNKEENRRAISILEGTRRLPRLNPVDRMQVLRSLGKAYSSEGNKEEVINVTEEALDTAGLLRTENRIVTRPLADTLYVAAGTVEQSDRLAAQRLYRQAAGFYGMDSSPQSMELAQQATRKSEEGSLASRRKQAEQRRMAQNRGFTLVEIMIALAVLGVLTAIIIPKVNTVSAVQAASVVTPSAWPLIVTTLAVPLLVAVTAAAVASLAAKLLSPRNSFRMAGQCGLSAFIGSIAVMLGLQNGDNGRALVFAFTDWVIAGILGGLAVMLLLKYLHVKKNRHKDNLILYMRQLQNALETLYDKKVSLKEVHTLRFSQDLGDLERLAERISRIERETEDYRKEKLSWWQIHKLFKAYAQEAAQVNREINRLNRRIDSYTDDLGAAESVLGGRLSSGLGFGENRSKAQTARNINLFSGARAGFTLVPTMLLTIAALGITAAAKSGLSTYEKAIYGGAIVLISFAAILAFDWLLGRVYSGNGKQSQPDKQTEKLTQITEQALSLAKEQAYEAGRICLEARKELIATETKDGKGHLVTKYDKQIESNIITAILSAFPGHDIIAEEDMISKLGFSRNPDSDFLWLIDPIDGTLPFAFKDLLGRNDRFTNVISLLYKGYPLMSVIYAPLENGGVLYYASELEDGAFLETKEKTTRIEVDSSSQLEEKSAFVHDESLRQQDKYPNDYLHPRTYATLQKKFRHATKLPSSGAFEQCQVAKGDYVLYMHPSPMKVWDLVPGTYIATKAGAQAVYADGSKFFPVTVERDKKEPRISGQVIVGSQPAVSFVQEVLAGEKKLAKDRHPAGFTVKEVLCVVGGLSVALVIGLSLYYKWYFVLAVVGIAAFLVLTNIYRITDAIENREQIKQRIQQFLEDRK